MAPAVFPAATQEHQIQQNTRGKRWRQT